MHKKPPLQDGEGLEDQPFKTSAATKLDTPQHAEYDATIVDPIKSQPVVLTGIPPVRVSAPIVVHIAALRIAITTTDLFFAVARLYTSPTPVHANKAPPIAAGDATAAHAIAAITNRDKPATHAALFAIV